MNGTTVLIMERNTTSGSCKVVVTTVLIMDRKAVSASSCMVVVVVAGIRR